MTAEDILTSGGHISYWKTVQKGDFVRFSIQQKCVTVL